MKIIEEPEVFMLAETEINHAALNEYFKFLNVNEDDFWPDSSLSDAEELVEVAGRSCYKSFGAKLNSNVHKIRKGNDNYLKNIIKSKHGSVLEHATLTFAFAGVSRVFTHELVRHRAGTAFSQESLRYVRLDELSAWYPESFGKEMIGKLYDALAKECKVPKDAMCRVAWVNDRVEFLRKMFIDTFEFLENNQRLISDNLMLNDLPKDFHIKKAVTSAMRRLAPIGLGTGIIFTTNHRNLRHIIEVRTSEAAEEEIRLVFRKVAKLIKTYYPNIYQDMTLNEKGEYIFEASKI